MKKVQKNWNCSHSELISLKSEVTVCECGLKWVLSIKMPYAFLFTFQIMVNSGFCKMCLAQHVFFLFFPWNNWGYNNHEYKHRKKSSFEQKMYQIAPYIFVLTANTYKNAITSKDEYGKWSCKWLWSWQKEHVPYVYSLFQGIRLGFCCFRAYYLAVARWGGPQCTRLFCAILTPREVQYVVVRKST